MAEGMYKQIDPLRLEMETKAIRDRKIYFSDEVDRDTIFKVLYYLERLEAIDKKAGTKEDITIVINSYGGVIYDILSYVSKIEELKDKGYKINTHVSGTAMSAGFIGGMVGSHRTAGRYSTFLFHQPSFGYYGTLKDSKAATKETERLWDIMKYLAKKYTKISEDKMNYVEEHNEDWILSAEEALELGIIDEIL